MRLRLVPGVVDSGCRGLLAGDRDAELPAVLIRGRRGVACRPSGRLVVLIAALPCPLPAAGDVRGWLDPTACWVQPCRTAAVTAGAEPEGAVGVLARLPGALDGDDRRSWGVSRILDSLVEAVGEDQIDRSFGAEVAVTGVQPDLHAFVGVSGLKQFDQVPQVEEAANLAALRCRLAAGPVLDGASAGSDGLGELGLGDAGAGERLDPPPVGRIRMPDAMEYTAV